MEQPLSLKQDSLHVDLHRVFLSRQDGRCSRDPARCHSVLIQPLQYVSRAVHGSHRCHKLARQWIRTCTYLKGTISIETSSIIQQQRMDPQLDTDVTAPKHIKMTNVAALASPLSTCESPSLLTST
uniref:Uncharacterized protein n=1 Tax=Peronospora matthiolae TaxID=2874970 RepID=A0AAV1TQZ2_9STRA